MIGLLFAVVLGATGDSRLELMARGKLEVRVAVRSDTTGSCTLVVGENMAQWRTVVGADETIAGPSAYVPARVATDRTRISVLAAGFSVIAVLHDAASGKLLGKVAGACERKDGATVVTPPTLKPRDIDICARKPLGGEVARLTGLVDGEMRRVDLETVSALACDSRPAMSVSADLPWVQEDPDFAEAEAAFKVDGVLPRGAYWSPEMVAAGLNALAQKYPADARLVPIATTHQKRPVMALAIGTGLQENDPRPTLFLNGGHHGDELLSTSVVMDAARFLLEGTGKRIRDKMVVWCVPLVNPDGLDMFLHTSMRGGRKNGRDADSDGQRGIHDGVDLNRNYPFMWRATASKGPEGNVPLSRMYPGPSAASEPEVQGIIKLAQREHFVASMSFHMGTVALLVPYTVSTAIAPAPNEAETIAKSIAGKLEVKDRLYEVDGTDQDWHRFANGTVAYIAEIAKWPPPQRPAARDAAIAQGRSLWRSLALRFIDGPSLTVHVHDTSGQPVAAQLKVDYQSVGNNESWSTRPRDGVAARYFLKPGLHHITLSTALEQKGITVMLKRTNTYLDVTWP